MFTESEKESRHRAVRQILDTDNLKALLLIGDTNVGSGLYGDLRYYTNHRTVIDRQAVVVFSDSESVYFVGRYGNQEQAAALRSFVSDCRRVGSNFVADVVELLKERGVVAGRIGVSFEMLPAPWYMYFEKELPQIEWVETHERIMQIRFQRSQEEADIYRKGAALADGSFEAAVKFIRPGVSEYEIVAEIEHYSRARGAEESFTEITSGKFALGDGNMLPTAHLPTNRRIEFGDTVGFIIAPRYEGYWTELVRRVNVGKPNHELEKINTAGCDAIKKGLEHLRPGNTVGDVYSAIESHVVKCGYELRTPIGHTSGLDLAESRLDVYNKMELSPGAELIIHPRLFTPDGKSNSFWGETYLVTQEGYERLTRIGDELLTL